MLNVHMRDKFTKKKDELSSNIKGLQSKYSTISTFRVISFLLGAGLLIVGVSDDLVWAGIIGAILLLTFVVLIKIHNDVARDTDIEKSKLDVVETYLKRFNNQWRELSITGKEFVEAEDTVSLDLDLLGDNSLFQMINVAHTEDGICRLVKDMKLQELDVNKIPRRNEAISELMSKEDFAVDFESAGVRLSNRKKKFSVEEFSKYCEDESIGYLPGWANVIKFIAPVIFIAACLLWVIGVFSHIIPLAVFFVILSFSWLTKTVTDRVIMPVYGIVFSLEDYLDMMEVIGEAEYKSDILQEIKNKVCGDKGAIKAFRKLKQLTQAYNIAYNPLIHQVLSGICLWDYHIASSVCKWKSNYGKHVKDSFSAIGEMEELMSLAVIGMTRQVGWAEVLQEESKRLSLTCEELYHPLINPEQVVSNSANIKNGITIITGSNMSGKTTFLRTLAVNLALAYMGAPICGKKLIAGYMKIFTSMRVTDDVAHGISTFYAEILRIKAMAEYRQLEKPMICFIDEIFKGTNSADRIVGATEAITKLSGDKSIAMVSTHDFELCTITDKTGEMATNYHFEEYYEDGELKFDYRIKDGRCTTTNARELLKMAGF